MASYVHNIIVIMAIIAFMSFMMWYLVGRMKRDVLQAGKVTVILMLSGNFVLLAYLELVDSDLIKLIAGTILINFFSTLKEDRK